MNTRKINIVAIIKETETASFSSIFEMIDGVSERTLSRDLSELVQLGYLETEGGGRSVSYRVTTLGRLFLPIDGATYAIPEPEYRKGALHVYQETVWQELPHRLFTKKEYQQFEALTTQYRTKVSRQSSDVRKRELERFVIELSWKSSRIEGNTYTLLDTERLIKEGIPSDTNTMEETKMILNHKAAFDFILEHPLDSNAITLAYFEKVHELLMQDLLVDIGWRKSAVGITGSNYRPLDNQFQIKEAVKTVLKKIHDMETVYDQALVCLCGVSYVQPFVDGNKRTARLLTNALLLHGDAAPLSYRNVDEVGYRSALLAFYEQLSIVPIQKIFAEQYEFAATKYS